MENLGVRERNIAVSIILSLVTCGIYGIYWFITLTDDVGRLSKDSRLSGGICFLLTIVTCGIYGFYWAYLIGKAIYNIKAEKGIANNSDNSVLNIILQVFGLNIIILAISQNEVNSLVNS